jgi:cell wall-associated NlpC family hydrolase
MCGAARARLTGGYSNGWLSVSAGGVDGWVYGAFVTQDSGYAERSVSSDSGYAGTMYTNDSVNLRTGPGLDRDVITELPAGEEVYLSGAVSNGFAEASTAYGDGWIFTDYLSNSPPSSSRSAPEPEPEPEPVYTAGQQMVDFAMQFLGQPYVWAGNQPGGFDCSGLTQYVTANILGQDITHSTELQFGYGNAVEYGNWQPGDLVFFANTYAAGITHVGIYIGDGTFIHAENPGTGVVISSLYDSYYSAHYAGARRLA